MPFKSKAQRRKFAQLLVEGKITPETFEEWNRATGGARLPEHVRPKKKGKARPAGKRARRKTGRKPVSQRPRKPASARKKRG